MAKKTTDNKNKRNFLSHNFFYFSLFFIIFSIIGVVFIFLQKNRTKKLDNVKVSLSWLHQAQFAGIYTAIEKEYYKEVGLEVQLEDFEFDKELEQDLADGKTDFSITHADRLLESISKGLDIKAVAAIYQISPHSILLPKDLFLSPQDLVGKILGVKGGNTSGKLLYSVILANFGIDAEDVTFKSLDFTTSEFEDIERGSIDMVDLYRTDQVYEFVKNDYDFQLFVPENFRFKTYGDVIATSDQMIKNKPAIVKSFVEATLKGWEYALDNPEEALSFTEKYINNKQ